jgi:short-subunit dehydrogenase
MRRLPPLIAKLLIGSTGAEIGVPFLAHDGGAKAYVHSLGEALHYEFKPRDVYVTVVPPPLTNTAVIARRRDATRPGRGSAAMTSTTSDHASRDAADVERRCSPTPAADCAQKIDRSNRGSTGMAA